MSKAIYLGVDRILPVGYTQLAYIQSTGTQYIDTGFKPNNNTHVTLDAQMVGTTSVGTMYCYFGARGGVYFYEIYKASTGNWNLTFLYNNVYNQYFTISDYTARRIVDVNKNVATIDGTTLTYIAATFQVNYNLFIGADNDNGTALAITPMKIYSCKIWNNGTLIRNFVPAKNSSGVAGLYDKVNNKFYTASGSGSFTAGTVYTLPTGGVSASITAIDIGVNNIARNVTYAYIGDSNGKARQVFPAVLSSSGSSGDSGGGSTTTTYTWKRYNINTTWSVKENKYYAGWTQYSDGTSPIPGYLEVYTCSYELGSYYQDGYLKATNIRPYRTDSSGNALTVQQIGESTNPYIPSSGYFVFDLLSSLSNGGSSDRKHIYVGKSNVRIIVNYNEIDENGYNTAHLSSDVYLCKADSSQTCGTYITTVTSTSPTAYPNNGISGSYWYIKQ